MAEPRIASASALVSSSHAFSVLVGVARAVEAGSASDGIPPAGGALPHAIAASAAHANHGRRELPRAISTSLTVGKGCRADGQCQKTCHGVKTHYERGRMSAANLMTSRPAITLEGPEVI